MIGAKTLAPCHRVLTGNKEQTKCMYVCMYVRMYVCMYVRTYVRVCICTYVHMYVCTYTLALIHGNDNTVFKNIRDIYIYVPEITYIYIYMFISIQQ